MLHSTRQKRLGTFGSHTRRRISRTITSSSFLGPVRDWPLEGDVDDFEARGGNGSARVGCNSREESIVAGRVVNKPNDSTLQSDSQLHANCNVRCDKNIRRAKQGGVSVCVRDESVCSDRSLRVAPPSPCGSPSRWPRHECQRSFCPSRWSFPQAPVRCR